MMKAPSPLLARLSNIRFVAAALLICVVSAPSQGQDQPPAFNASAAWTSFQQLVRQSYAYFERPGIDGESILSTFAPRAKAARTDAEFIDILQLVAHNFADPHFVVGPLTPSDWSVIPTTSDMYASFDGKHFRIKDVRADSDAMRKGVRIGMAVATIGGTAPRVLIEEISGRPFAQLSPPQIDFALNTALAGRRGETRSIALSTDHKRLLFSLNPTADQAKRVSAGPMLETERRGALGIIRINNSLGNNALIPAFATALHSLANTRTLLIDLRNTPSGGNTTVARGIMGHFVSRDLPYQMHMIPYEARVFGPTRKFVEYVVPFGERYAGKVYVAGGRWTGSMGEGLMVGFDAIGAITVGSELADLLGALSNRTIEGSAAKVDLGTEELFMVSGQPRAAFRPHIYLEHAERDGLTDPVLAAIEADFAH